MRRPTLRLNCLSRLFKKLQRHRTTTITSFNKPTSAQYTTTSVNNATSAAAAAQLPKAHATIAVPVIKYDDMHQVFQIMEMMMMELMQYVDVDVPWSVAGIAQIAATLVLNVEGP
ncbi:hypothetical protein LRAMOSA06770 [Lichtheimia ramosa]|uniref:Uncharacterized protein n=1 Tax=Lichtheimia ramosa TaxID=688394 RepID=A0A077WAM3_9FUNG|nr:hypothetical protein LRAMOSA06770 [Lichtheimia ramosa]